jgi:hypothetical protein
MSENAHQATQPQAQSQVPSQAPELTPAPAEPFQLIAYRIHPYPSMPIVPAPSQRQWMNETHERFAYRCLPLLIANQSGWLILNVHKIRVAWNGGPKANALTIKLLGGPQHTPCPVTSHFGHGIVTFSLNYLFRTPPGYNLYCRGPANAPKDGIVPLEGIIETDWSVATFTMNWKITAISQPIDFEPGEPICMISPIKRGEVETFQPMVRDLSTQPELEKAFNQWSQSRSKFLTDLVDPNSQARQEKWQKDYVQGVTPDGREAPSHQVKLNLKEFDLPQP